MFETPVRMCHPTEDVDPIGRCMHPKGKKPVGAFQARLTMSAKFLGSALNSGRGILPRRSGWKPLQLFRWIPTEHFKAAIET